MDINNIYEIAQLHFLSDFFPITQICSSELTDHSSQLSRG